MTRPLATLLERAAESLPPQRPARSQWSPLAPVVRQLRINGYDVMGAVDWLIGEGEIRAADRAKAYRCLLALVKCHGAEAAAGGCPGRASGTRRARVR